MTTAALLTKCGDQKKQTIKRKNYIMNLVTWLVYQNDNFAGYQNANPNFSEKEILAKFEKRTGLMATHALKIN